MVRGLLCQLPEDVFQDAAVALVFEVCRHVDAAVDFKYLRLAVIALGLD